MSSGIYLIKSPSGKEYIGSALNLTRRWSRHKNDLKTGKHHNKPLQLAFDKYGLEALEFKILLECEPKDLLLYEQKAIDVIKPEYNTCKVAGSQLGVKRSAEYLAKKIGKKWSEGQKLKASLAQKGRPSHWRGRKQTTEHIENNRKARLGLPSALAGRKQSDEWIAKRLESFNRNKELRRIICIENGNTFDSVKDAVAWCIEQGLTKSSNITSINRSIAGNCKAFKLTWKLYKED